MDQDSAINYKKMLRATGFSENGSSANIAGCNYVSNYNHELKCYYLLTKL